jgi:hypothetical protein
VQGTRSTALAGGFEGERLGMLSLAGNHGDEGNG